MLKRIHILGASGSGITTMYVQQLGFTTRDVYTLANAGKVKRIHRNPCIRLAPCTMCGTVIGPWMEEENIRHVMTCRACLRLCVPYHPSSWSINRCCSGVSTARGI